MKLAWSLTSWLRGHRRKTQPPVFERTYAEVQLAQTLTDLAALEKTDEELDEAADLLANAQKRYSDGGASLASAGAARELEKTQKVRAKLATN
jgi:hypothetical protein